MTHHPFLLLLVCLVACATPSTPPTPRAALDFTATDRAAIAAVLDAQTAAWNRGDLAGYMAGYARLPDLVFTSGGTIRCGWQTTFDHYRARYGSDRAGMGRLSFELIALQPLGADGAIVLGSWRVDGGASPGHGLFSVGVERRPEGWRIVHDHTSSSPQQPPPPASPPG